MNKILIFSGAGLSAESGISTFRDENGLWNGIDPMQVANISTFRKNQNLVREFYNARREQLATVLPNSVHEGIAKLQKDYGDQVEIFTQNVDDLLERAGCTDVCHVHGHLTGMMCLDPVCNHKWEVGYNAVSEDSSCPECGNKFIKPAVVFFGESAPEYERLYSTFAHSRQDLIIVIGTSGEVVPLERIAGNRRSTRKSYTIINNKEYDAYGNVNLKLFDLAFFKPATEAWPRIHELCDKFIAHPHVEGQEPNEP